jgi:transcriptional regulator with XRE-family HTH domain
MTAAELSRTTGVAKQVLSDWMAGVQPRKLEQLYLVAQTLGVLLEDLCFAPAEELTKAKPSQIPTGDGGGSDALSELRGKYEVYFRRINDE